VRIDGHDVAALSDRRLSALRAGRIGFVFQHFHLAPGQSALDNVADGLLYPGVAIRERRRRAEATLVRIGLGDRLEHRPHELSGGERQRVAIARAVVGDPAVLLADEPTGNLDEDTRDEIIGLLEKLWLDRGLTMVLITHDSAVARRAQRVGVMKQGNLTITRDSRHSSARKAAKA
jgi:putative ABC transport system ATP-binding protein